ncbi:homeobox protein MSX-2 [Cotesia glomerata]|uniref:Homeobox domain-containing protein n=1 Tax=Cotesia glomerata TaxID=32391 RepID=A0AAV7I5P4_COTGL|nr:homeobox protein MSX-2 [Cotesia glomerata]KAH0544024.1 hypothetical protein KQX54_000901 [Cotesia glomerata]
MSGSHRPNRKSSDFSIARILSRSSNKTNQSTNLHLIMNELAKDRVKIPESYNDTRHCHESNQSIINTSTGDNDNLSRTRFGFFIGETHCAPSSSSTTNDSESIKTSNNDIKCELPRDNNKLLPNNNLSWLQCTRYRPPKLPRKSLAGKICKRKPATHPRIPFTSFQLQTLEEKYKKSAYLSRKDVVQLSTILRLPHNRIKIWFQNRRARDRRETQVTNSLI